MVLRDSVCVTGTVRCDGGNKSSELIYRDKTPLPYSTLCFAVGQRRLANQRWKLSSITVVSHKLYYLNDLINQGDEHQGTSIRQLLARKKMLLL